MAEHIGRASIKPSFSFMAYGFDSFTEASYACWTLSNSWRALLKEKFGNDFNSGIGDAANRFREIERELGPRVTFAGKRGLKGSRFATK